MAIQSTYNAPETGLEVNGAYMRIHGYHGNKDGMRFDVEVFVSKQARDAGMQNTGFLHFMCPVQPGDILPALYAYLKTLPEFANAIDV